MWSQDALTFASLSFVVVNPWIFKSSEYLLIMISNAGCVACYYFIQQG